MDHKGNMCAGPIRMYGSAFYGAGLREEVTDRLSNAIGRKILILRTQSDDETAKGCEYDIFQKRFQSFHP